MSAVPPHLAASVLQSNVTQRQVSSVRDTERNQRANADTQQARAIDQADSTVEITDESSEVYSDAEGAGSQGRAFSPAPEDEDALNTASDDPDDPDDTEEGQHIDLSV